MGPAAGVITGDTPITITGTGFGNPGDTDLVNLVPNGGGTPIAAIGVVVQNSTTITAVTGDATASVPAGQHSIVTDVEVTAGTQTSPVNAPADQFTYASVSISSITPPTGSPVGGTTLTINGHGFGSSSTDVLVLFCAPGTTNPDAVGATCSEGDSTSLIPGVGVSPENDTTIAVVDPAWSITTGSSEAVVVFVKVFPPPGSNVASSTSNGFIFTYGVSISSITPPTGSPVGGQRSPSTDMASAAPPPTSSSCSARLAPPTLTQLVPHAARATAPV